MWWKRTSPAVLLIAFVGVISALRLAVIGGVPFSPDEAYYYSWSFRPAVCYYDQPGMIAWVDWIGRVLAPGINPFNARVPAVALSAITAIVLYFAYRDYRDDNAEAAIFAAGFAVLPFSWIYGVLIIHDAALMPWLALTYWAIFRLAKHDGRPGDWMLLGISLTGAMYAKFSAVMIAWGLLLFMLWSPKGRRWFRAWPPYAAGALSAVLYAPVIVWNYRHDFISLAAVRELTATNLKTGAAERALSALAYVGGQAGMFSPILGVLMFVALGRGVARAWKDPADERVTLPVCLVVPVYLYFFQQSLRTSVFGNWPNIYYIPFAMLAMSEAAAYLRDPRTGTRARRMVTRLIAAGVALDLAIIGAATLHLRSRTFRPLLESIETLHQLDRRIDWRLDLDFGGWEEMRQVVEESRPGCDFILTRRYQVAGMLEFMLPDHPRVEGYNRGQRGNQWDLWSTLDERAGQTALYVDYKRMPAEVRERCEAVEPVPGASPMIVGDPQAPVKKWYLYRCRGWKPGPR